MTFIDKIDHSVLDGYRTCEFATLAKDGTPLAWPTSPFRQQDGTLLITTSIAFAQKALNVRRDGRVALLFSDPTGSGLGAPAQIFIGGSAQCSGLTTSPAGLEEYWSMLFPAAAVQPRLHPAGGAVADGLVLHAAADHRNP